MGWIGRTGWICPETQDVSCLSCPSCPSCPFLARTVQFARAEERMKLIGIALIVVGVLALALGGIRYTTREKVLDLGPIEATTEKHKMIPLSPIVGIAAVVGGIAVLVVGSRTRV